MRWKPVGALETCGVRWKPAVLGAFGTRGAGCIRNPRCFGLTRVLLLVFWLTRVLLLVFWLTRVYPGVVTSVLASVLG